MYHSLCPRGGLPELTTIGLETTLFDRRRPWARGSCRFCPPRRSQERAGRSRPPGELTLPLSIPLEVGSEVGRSGHGTIPSEPWADLPHLGDRHPG